MNVFSRTSALAGIAVVALTVAGCGSGDDTMAGMSTSSAPAATTAASSTSSGTASTTASSEPMTSMSDMSPSTSSTAPTSTASGQVSAEHNEADVMFTQMMIEHHRGAIEMAQLAPDRAASQQVKDLAAKIEAAQAPEIELMTSWLQAWDAAMSTGGMDMATTGGGMDMGTTSGGMDMSTSSSGMAGMPGMMTAEQMTALTAATGAEFDRMFLEMMVMHHQGAVAMADTEIAEGTNQEALTLAESIKTSQTAEIAEMQQL
jgi:uncharacterized protein (DUF305 family)